MFKGGRGDLRTLFLYCLWMASMASLMVTPLRFRAVTSRPRGKCRSIFLTGGVVSSFLRTSLSSIVEGEVLIFLRGCHVSQLDVGWQVREEEGDAIPARLLGLLCDLKLNSILLCLIDAVSDCSDASGS